ncbi:hypothetical protein [Alkalihalobacillus sp. BA299]|uniref:hypothetical protein n=1 Tax=Alkalihalobacillus sp. BA299 TaxID=2815938 RepID=UPI001AD9D934|nr:hypothetical protein [Alkalihalobacillus sp. BA299]
MSIKPIEMQGSFPRSQGVGKIQEQLQQRAQVGQDIISTQYKRDEDQKRKQVNKSNESDLNKLEPDKEKEKDQKHQDQNRKNKHDKKQDISEHPYKGKFIDFSG